MATKWSAAATYLMALMALLASTDGSDLPGSDGRHPLTSPTSCHAFGPQAVMEALREKVDDINKDQLEKYLKILKYLTPAPKFLNDYLSGEDMALEHGETLFEFEAMLRRRLQLVRLDVLLPWARLAQVQQLAGARGSLQGAARRTLYTNLRLTLNSTETTTEKILDNISGLVDQFRRLFMSYKNIMVSWIEAAWVEDSTEQQQKTIHDIFWHDFPPMLAKPLLYLLEDKNLEFYHAYPSGYEEVFVIFQRLRSSINEIELASNDDTRWKLLLERIPKGGSSSERRPVTQAQMEMEEEVLATHIVDMITGYPQKKGKQS